MDISLFDLSVLMAKTAIILAVLLIAYRLLGKRDIAQLNPYDLVTIMAIANAVQNAMTAGRGEIWVGLACSSTLVLGTYGLSRLFVRNAAVERLLVGEPVVLLHRGELFEDRMRRERVTHDELAAAFRQHGLHKADQVDLAVLEVDGSISVIPRDTATRIDIDSDLGHRARDLG